MSDPIFILYEGGESGMNIIKQTGTANTTYMPGRTIPYLAVHYTAGVSSKKGSARSTASWFANPNLFNIIQTHAIDIVMRLVVVSITQKVEDYMVLPRTPIV